MYTTCILHLQYMYTTFPVFFINHCILNHCPLYLSVFLLSQFFYWALGDEVSNNFWLYNIYFLMGTLWNNQNLYLPGYTYWHTASIHDHIELCKGLVQICMKVLYHCYPFSANECRSDNANFLQMNVGQKIRIYLTLFSLWDLVQMSCSKELQEFSCCCQFSQNNECRSDN